MRRSRATFISFLAVVLCGGAGWTQSAQEARDFGTGAVHRSIQWVSPSGARTTAGLFLLDMTPAGMVERILAQDTADRPIIVTWTLDVRNGREWSEFLDDETGWWARLEVDTGVRADTLGAYFTAAGRQLQPGHTLNMKLVTREGLVFERRLALANTEALPYQDFVADLVADGPAEELVAVRPPELVAAVFFLDAFMSQGPLQTEWQDSHVGYNMRGVVEVLAGVFRQQAGVDAANTTRAEAWKMTVGDFKRGIGIVDPDLLELVSRFRSVENADPLSDHLAQEILGETRALGSR